MYNTNHSITEISVTLVKHRTALFKDSARTACNISAIIAGAGKTPAHCSLGLLNYLDSFCRTCLDRYICPVKFSVEITLFDMSHVL